MAVKICHNGGLVSHKQSSVIHMMQMILLPAFMNFVALMTSFPVALLKRAVAKLLRFVCRGLPFSELENATRIGDVISVTVGYAAHSSRRKGALELKHANLGTVLIRFNQFEDSNTITQKKLACARS
jgi:hypothetical protein